jgi:hypothetical protein
VPWRALAVVAVLAVALSPAIWGFMSHGYGPVDSVLALTSVDEDATAYTEGYDEERYHDLLMGTDVDDLVATLGQPFSRFRQEAGATHWHYTKLAGVPGRRHHQRIVVVSELGKVMGTLSTVSSD